MQSTNHVPPDWAALQREYLEGGTTYRALAKKHGVPYVALANRAKREGWAEKRRQQSSRGGMSVSTVADALSEMLYHCLAELDSPAVGDIDKAAGALKKIQDIQRGSEEREDCQIVLHHQIPRQLEAADTSRSD